MLKLCKRYFILRLPDTTALKNDKKKTKKCQKDSSTSSSAKKKKKKKKKDGPVLEGKSSFKMLGLTFSSKLDLGSYINSTAQTTTKKIGALIHSMKFPSPEVTLWLYKSTIQPCMEYCCHVWAGAPSYYLEFLGKLQNWI